MKMYFDVLDLLFDSGGNSKFLAMEGPGDVETVFHAAAIIHWV